MSAYEITIIREDRYVIAGDEAADGDEALEVARGLGCTCPGGTETRWWTDVRPVET